MYTCICFWQRIDKVLITAIFVFVDNLYNVNNSVCVCVCVWAYVCHSLMMQQWWWRRVASLSCGEKLISQGSHTAEPEACLFVCVSLCINVYVLVCLSVFASVCINVCAVRPPKLNIDVLIRRLCCLKPFAPRGVLLTHIHTHSHTLTLAHTHTHTHGAWLLTTVSSFLWEQLLTTGVVSRHIVSLSYRTVAECCYKAHLPHVHSLGC